MSQPFEKKKLLAFLKQANEALGRATLWKCYQGDACIAVVHTNDFDRLAVMLAYAEEEAKKI